MNKGIILLISYIVIFFLLNLYTFAFNMLVFIFFLILLLIDINLSISFNAINKLISIKSNFLFYYFHLVLLIIILFLQIDRIFLSEVLFFFYFIVTVFILGLVLSCFNQKQVDLIYPFLTKLFILMFAFISIDLVYFISTSLVDLTICVDLKKQILNELDKIETLNKQIKELEGKMVPMEPDHSFVKKIFFKIYDILKNIFK